VKIWIDRLLLLAVVVILLVSVAGLIPWLTGSHLEGWTLMLHMGTGGALVSLLPLFALSCQWRMVGDAGSNLAERIGFWGLILTGLLTIVTVFLCMLPLMSTEQMRQSMVIHTYAGFAMVPALAVLLIGWLRTGRSKSQSSTR
jgi:hypothetical protein